MLSNVTALKTVCDSYVDIGKAIYKPNAIGDDLLKVTNDGELDECEEQKLDVYGKLKVKIFLESETSGNKLTQKHVYGKLKVKTFWNQKHQEKNSHKIMPSIGH